MGIGVSALIFTVAAAALNLIYGFTGLLSFAQLGFWGIGGYATALTVVTFGGNFWWGLVWAALINAAVALVVGYPTLRTNRHAFVIVTLTFALLVTLIARDWVDLTRGPLGIPNLPPPTAFGYQLRHHRPVLLDRLGLLGGDAGLPLRAVQLAHRPHPDRHQAERAPGARPGHLADALQARSPSPSAPPSPARRAASSPSISASSTRCSSTSITCRPS